MRDWLATRTDATPRATALAAAGDVATASDYADLHERVEVLAGRLAARGVGVDDRLVVCTGTRAEYVDLVHAAQRLGAVLVPIDARLTVEELRERVGRVSPAAVVCEAETEAAVLSATDAPVLTVDEPGAAGETGRRDVGDGGVPDDGSPEADGDPLGTASVGRVGSHDDPAGGSNGEPSATPDDATGRRTERLDAVRPVPFDLPEWESDDPLVVMFTSGTTGEPRGVILTLGNVLASATASAFRLGVRRDDCWHVTLPMYHMGGLAPVYRSVLYGTSLSVQQGFDPDETLAALEAADATAVSLVPTMLDRLLDAGTLPDLRFVLLGGAACPPELLRRAHGRDVPVATTYGMTEAGSQIATALPSETREAPESVGNPLMFASVSVLDRVGRTCDPGEPGELVVSGPMITPGYLNDEATSEAYRDGGLRTGDRGHRDPAGRLYVHGRVDDTIVTGGENVDPAEVATELRAHQSVADCAVVGLEHEEWGEQVAALVVPLPDGSATDEELRAHCRERLAGYKLPRRIAFVEALPRTVSGTVDRDAARDLLRDVTGHEKDG